LTVVFNRTPGVDLTSTGAGVTLACHVPWERR